MLSYFPDPLDIDTYDLAENHFPVACPLLHVGYINSREEFVQIDRAKGYARPSSVTSSLWKMHILCKIQLFAQGIAVRVFIIYDMAGFLGLLSGNPMQDSGIDLCK